MQKRAKKISEVFYRGQSSYFSIGEVVGIDEAGRGAWAGSVFASACIFLDKSLIKDPSFSLLCDSKKITRKGRELIFNILNTWKNENKIDFEVSSSSSEEIDSMGIKKANNLAMQRAIEGLVSRLLKNPAYIKNTLGTLQICIDGNDHYSLNIPQEINTCEIFELIRGDDTIKEISAASILAKVSRDFSLSELGKKHSEYGFENHKGYGTKKHIEAIYQYGVLPFHRKSYAPIKKFTQSS